MKKLILILAVIFILAAIGLFIYKSQSIGTPGENATSTGSNEFPSGGSAANLPDDNTTSFPSSNNNSNNSETTTGEAGTNNNSEADSVDNIVREEIKVAKKISDGPVSGMSTYGSVRDLNLSVRFVSKESGNIWDYHPIGDSRVRVGADTILRSQQVIWGNQAQSALVRYFDETGNELKNYILRIPVNSTSTNSSAESHFLSSSISSFVAAPPGAEIYKCSDYLTKNLSATSAIDPIEVRKLQSFLEISTTGIYDSATTAAVKTFQIANKIDPTGNIGPITRAKINSIYCARSGKRVEGTKLIYLEETIPGKYAINITDFDSKVVSTLYNSSFGEWLMSWPEANTLVLATKPSRNVAGYAYTAPVRGVSKANLLSNLKPLVSNVTGLTVNVNSLANLVVYTKTSTSFLGNVVLDVKTGEERAFPVTTFVREKCVWDKNESTVIYCAVPRTTPTGSSLESWYLGTIRTQDSIFKIDLETDTVTLLYAPDSGPDVSEIKISEDSSFLYFIDRSDESLWALQLSSLTQGIQ